MLAYSLLPTTLWAEAVNTACYVQNRVLVTKPHNKTPYELLHGRPPSISFMRPFRCPVTILNTLDPLGKFVRKANEGFLVGYSINSKAFRVFNTRTRKVEENLHITVLKNKPNVAGSRPDWLFDIDLLTNSMNYEPVAAGNQTNRNAGIKDNVDAKEGYATSTNRVSTVSLSVSVAGQSFDNANDLPTDPLMSDQEDTIDLLNTGIFSGAYDDEDEGAEADLNNLETTMNVWTLVDLPNGKRAIGTKWVFRNKKDERGIVVRNKPRLMAQGYTQEEEIDYDEVFAPVARIEAIGLFLAYTSFMRFIVYQMDVKSAFLYGTIEEEVYVCQPLDFEDPQFPDKVYKVEKALYGLHQAPRAWYETLSTYLLENGFRRGTIDKTLFIKKYKGDILLVQVYVDDIIFGSTKKSLCVEFEQMMHMRFQMSSMREITFFLGLQVKQKDDGILINQDKFQVTPKVSYLHVVKRIFRYLKGQPKLGLWYPRDSPFDLKAFSDSDYAGASLDKKSTTGGYQFLGKRLISWQCKKQIIVANSTIEAEYAVAANYCGQVLWIQNQMLDYGFNFMNTKIHIDNESTICIVKNPVFHAKTKHIEIRHHFIRDSYEKRLI
ncbi:retrovirus-related pol polyprotein from transposon TNT 1-94 [Tanacetum coccineum]